MPRIEQYIINVARNKGASRREARAATILYQAELRNATLDEMERELAHVRAYHLLRSDREFAERVRNLYREGVRPVLERFAQSCRNGSSVEEDLEHRVEQEEQPGQEFSQVA